MICPMCEKLTDRHHTLDRPIVHAYLKPPALAATNRLSIGRGQSSSSVTPSWTRAPPTTVRPRQTSTSSVPVPHPRGCKTRTPRCRGGPPSSTGRTSHTTAAETVAKMWAGRTPTDRSGRWLEVALAVVVVVVVVV